VPVQVMNAILGGLFSSRINLNLREVHGYTYGAGSGFVYRRSRGPFYVSTMVRTDSTAPSVKEIFSELEGMRASQVKPEELSMARETLIRNLTGIFETTNATAGTMSNLFTYGLPLDYYRTLPEKIGGVTAAEIQRVAQKYIAPDQMVIVVVGDRTAVEPELRKLNLGPVEVYDTNLQKVN
jgi:zinc protease